MRSATKDYAGRACNSPGVAVIRDPRAHLLRTYHIAVNSWASMSFLRLRARRRRRPRLLLRRRRRRPLLLPLVKFLLVLLLLLRAPLLYRGCLTHQRMRLLRSLIVPRLPAAIFLRLHISICRRWRALVRLSPPIFSRLRPAILWLRSFRLVVDPWLRIRHLPDLIVALVAALFIPAVRLRERTESILRLPVILVPVLRPVYWTNQRASIQMAPRSRLPLLDRNWRRWRSSHRNHGSADNRCRRPD